MQTLQTTSTTTMSDCKAPDFEDKSVAVNEKKCMSDSVDDWEYSEENPRNWSTAKKWTTMSVVSHLCSRAPSLFLTEVVLKVSLYALLAPLGSSMMAPALVQVGTRYDITNDTILAMTLSIFLLSFALGSLTLPPLSVTSSLPSRTHAHVRYIRRKCTVENGSVTPQSSPSHLTHLCLTIRSCTCRISSSQSSTLSAHSYPMRAR